MAWLAQNWGTLLVAALVVGVLAAVVVARVRAKRAGKSSCSCGCSACGMKGICHPDKEE